MSGYGWKSNKTKSHKLSTDMPTCKDGETGGDFFQCIENDTYSNKEIILKYSKDFLKVKPFFIFGFMGIAQSMEAISLSLPQIDIVLNGNFRYFVYLTDPKLTFNTLKPITPRTRVAMTENEGLVLLNLKVCNNCISVSLNSSVIISQSSMSC